MGAANTLKQPEEYLGALLHLRSKNKYAHAWTLRLERKTNRHPSCDGSLWGWYEVFPLDIEVGFWGSGGDALCGVNIAEWNARAEKISNSRSGGEEE